MTTSIFSQTDLIANILNCTISGTFHELERPLRFLQIYNQPSFNIHSDHDVFYFSGRKIEFTTEGGDFTADIPDGTYRPSEAQGIISGAMCDEAGVTDISCWFVKYDTISGYTFRFNKGAGTLELKCSTSSDKAHSIYPMIGYAGSADRTGALEYFGDHPVTSSGGHFTITSSNNKVYIASHTATLTAGDYQRGELLAELKAQMDSTNSANDADPWFDESTLKFHLDFGTARTVDFASTTNSAASTLGFNNSNQSSATSHVADNIRIHTDEILDMAFASAVQAYSLLITNHNLTSSAVVTIAADNTPDWSSPAFGPITLTWSAAEIYELLTTLAASYSYYRIKIVDRSNPAGFVELWAFLGPTLDDDVNFDLSGHTGWELSTDSVPGQDIAVSSYGVQFGNIKFDLDRRVYPIIFIDDSQRANLEALWKVVQNVKPFFVLMETDADIGTPWAQWVVFGSRPVYTRSPINQDEGWSTVLTLVKYA
jgi:hypothetical protein